MLHDFICYMMLGFYGVALCLYIGGVLLYMDKDKYKDLIK